MTDRELLEKIANDVDELRNEMGELKRELKTEIGKDRLELENEIIDNISIIAEGHLDLARQFNDVIKAGMRVVNIEVRTNVLETKVRQIAKQIKVS